MIATWKPTTRYVKCGESWRLRSLSHNTELMNCLKLCGLSVRTDQMICHTFLTQRFGFRNPDDKWQKLMIPMFDEEDAFGWTSRVEYYFNLKGVKEQEKIQAGISGGNPVLQILPGRISRLQYRTHFELFAGLLRTAKPEYLKGVVKAELRLHPVTTLPELMDYAQHIDEKNVLLNQWNAHDQKSATFHKKYPSKQTTPNTMAGDTSGTKKYWFILQQGRNLGDFTDTELPDKLTKGLCVRCDEKFSPGHICTNKQFNVLIMEGEEEDT
ncbi:hypothetical protein L195_g037008 [Trifolium pratense]|uniref:Uncharacterized protein n=1 Tax=Trifolium pratense TaxID=57577 RepID=A0A2K3LR24_TRIPR|nr:hypothetical protein L195_g037008 [Trifolium pratense]